MRTTFDSEIMPFFFCGRQCLVLHFDTLQGKKGWDGCHLPVTTTAAIVITVMNAIFLLSSWEELGNMNYKGKGKSIKPYSDFYNHLPLLSATLNCKDNELTLALLHRAKMIPESSKILPQVSASPYSFQIIPPLQ